MHFLFLSFFSKHNLVNIQLKLCIHIKPHKSEKRRFCLFACSDFRFRQSPLSCSLCVRAVNPQVSFPACCLPFVAQQLKRSILATASLWTHKEWWKEQRISDDRFQSTSPEMPVIKQCCFFCVCVTTHLFSSSPSISEKKYPALPLTRGQHKVSALYYFFFMTSVCLFFLSINNFLSLSINFIIKKLKQWVM